MAANPLTHNLVSVFSYLFIHLPRVRSVPIQRIVTGRSQMAANVLAAGRRKVLIHPFNNGSPTSRHNPHFGGKGALEELAWSWNGAESEEAVLIAKTSLTGIHFVDENDDNMITLRSMDGPTQRIQF